MSWACVLFTINNSFFSALVGRHLLENTCLKWLHHTDNCKSIRHYLFQFPLYDFKTLLAPCPQSHSQPQILFVIPECPFHGSNEHSAVNEANAKLIWHCMKWKKRICVCDCGMGIEREGFIWITLPKTLTHAAGCMLRLCFQRKNFRELSVASW